MKVPVIGLVSKINGLLFLEPRNNSNQIHFPFVRSVHVIDLISWDGYQSFRTHTSLERSKVGTKRLNLGTKDPWVRNDWIPLGYA